jgi:transposase
MIRMEHNDKDYEKYSLEVRERAVRLVLEGTGQHENRWAAIMSKIGCARQTLNEWVKTVEVDTGQCGGITTAQAEKMKALKREVCGFKRTNEIPRKVPAYFAPTLIAAKGDCRAARRSSTSH